MGRNDGTAIGEQRVIKRDGWIEVLTNIQISMVERCSDHSEEELIGLWGWLRNCAQCELVIIASLGDGDGPRHFRF